MRTLTSFVALLLMLAPSCPAAEPGGSPAVYDVYVGTYNQRGSEGIYRYRFDTRDGSLVRVGLAAPARNASFLATSPDGRTLYAVREAYQVDGENAAAVAAYRIDPATGGLTELGAQAVESRGPCYVSVDPTGQVVLVATYGGGSVAAFPVQGDGSLGPAGSVVQHQGQGALPKRQAGPHAHSIDADPTGQYAIAADLGLDKLLVYRLDPAAATLEPASPASIDTAPGAGPRHLAFHPGGDFAYAVNELNNTLTVYRWDAEAGRLTDLQTAPLLPDGFTGRSAAAEVQVRPDGRFVYASNRGHNSIAVFAIDPATGHVSLVEHEPTRGDWPRHFSLDPSGRWMIVANERSDTLAVFRIDPETGQLDAVGEPVPVAAPVCVRFGNAAGGER